MKSHSRKKYSIQARNFSLNLGRTTKIMGIINITPDSFSHDGCIRPHSNFTDKAVLLARRLIKEGAEIIDIGGESSRPGSKRISDQTEIKRVIPAIKKLARRLKVPISVDTYKATVAQHALDAGASIINNIKGVQSEKALLKMVRNYGACIVLMHMKGTPRTMQKRVHYSDLMNEIFASLQKSIENCLEFGIKSDRIIIDPGIGFGKTLENNLEIIDRLDELKALNQPILIGTSRKSFIGKTLQKDVDKRLMGSVATVCASILKGVHIVRVHDVKQMLDIVKMSDAIINHSALKKE